MLRLFFFLFSLLIISCSHASVVDFCVADLTAPETPAGFSCKNPATVTVDDFVFTGLATPANSSSLPPIFKVGITTAFDAQFPGLNGLGISAARADIAPGGVIPMHNHRETELLLIEEGIVTVGFISSANKAYVKTLKKGELFVFPQSLLHFQVNGGSEKAIVFAFFTSANPGLTILDLALFSNNLPSLLLEESAKFDAEQVKKLKAVFGGTG